MMDHACHAERCTTVRNTTVVVVIDKSPQEIFPLLSAVKIYPKKMEENKCASKKKVTSKRKRRRK
jgi:hypothetical protein